MIADVINATTLEYVGVFIIDKDGRLIMKIPGYNEVIYDIADPRFSPGSVKIEMIRIRNMRQFEREGPHDSYLRQKGLSS